MSESLTMHPDPFALAPIAEDIWRSKYRWGETDGTTHDGGVTDTWRRVAQAAAAAEPTEAQRAVWCKRFVAALETFALLPAGRIIAGAGTGRGVTLFNCFVMGRIEDDLAAIFDQVKEAALTMQKGGGIGHDFSTLRPRGALVRSIGAGASGPVSFMDVWDAMCRSIMSAGSRRGAMMAVMRCDHPDIELFIAAKADPARLRNFNLSVLVTDAFVAAVRSDALWDLTFEGRVYQTVRAREIWHKIMQATYDFAEPGVVFIDRVNALNNLAYCETIHATNPCGEQPLPPYGACLLGSINLARLVRQPFTADAALDVAALEALTATAVRLLDNVIDVSDFPLQAQREEALAKRRIGLGVTGLANALAMCGVRYGRADAVRLASDWLGTLKVSAYRASAELAGEKGAFALCDADALLARPNLATLPDDVRRSIARHGLRNGCLTSIAPTGTISLLAGNVSSGIEPVFAHAFERRVLNADGSHRLVTVDDYGAALYRATVGGSGTLPDCFVTAHQLTPDEHLAMQAAVQPHVDSAISKTINCPAGIAFSAFEQIYLDAFDAGLKGCTTFRPNAVTGAVLSRSAVAEAPKVDAAATPVAGVRTVVGHEATSVAADATSPPTRPHDVVYLSRPLERAQALAGYTTKLRWPGSDHALYVTINDIEHAGRRRPFEIFINTKTLEHQAWTVALTRMISAVFRRGGDVSFVVEELKSISDPQGGHWVGGRYVPSLIAAIGDLIEAHMIRIGFLASESSDRVETEPAMQGIAGDVTGSEAVPSGGEANRSVAARGRACPRCQSFSLVRREGCWVCETCDYSRCS